MGSKLRSIFERSASAPLTSAQLCFGRNQWALGMKALSEDQLREAWAQGMRHVARRTGLPYRQVVALFAAQSMETVLQGYADHQRQALETAQRYGTNITSFVARSLHREDSTTSSYLRAIASRHADDAFISEPIAALAGDLERWQDFLQWCGETIDGEGRLQKLVTRRLLTKLGIAACFVLISGIGLGVAAWWYLVKVAARKRIDDAIAVADPCADAKIPAQDLRQATEAQRASIQHRKVRCEELTARKNYESSCLELATQVAGHQWNDTVAKTAGTAAALLQRVATSSLTLEDLRIQDGALPCQDTPAGAQLWDAFSRTAAKAEELWATCDTVSPKTAALLTRPGFELSPESQTRLSGRADAFAKQTIVRGLPEELDRARSLCTLQTTLRVEPLGRGCKAIFRLTKPR